MIRNQATNFNLTLVDNSTEVIYLGHGDTRGFFAWIQFAVAPSATIEISLGPTADTLTHIPDLDMAVTDIGPHTFDIGTRARYLQITIQSGVGFDADVVVSRS